MAERRRSGASLLTQLGMEKVSPKEADYFQRKTRSGRADRRQLRRESREREERRQRLASSRQTADDPLGDCLPLECHSAAHSGVGASGSGAFLRRTSSRTQSSGRLQRASAPIHSGEFRTPMADLSSSREPLAAGRGVRKAVSLRPARDGAGAKRWKGTPAPFATRRKSLFAKAAKYEESGSGTRVAAKQLESKRMSGSKRSKGLADRGFGAQRRAGRRAAAGHCFDSDAKTASGSENELESTPPLASVKSGNPRPKEVAKLDFDSDSRSFSSSPPTGRTLAATPKSTDDGSEENETPRTVRLRKSVGSIVLTSKTAVRCASPSEVSPRKSLVFDSPAFDSRKTEKRSPSGFWLNAAKSKRRIDAVPKTAATDLHVLSDEDFEDGSALFGSSKASATGGFGAALTGRYEEGLCEVPRMLLPVAMNSLRRTHEALDSSLAIQMSRNHFFVAFGELKSLVQRITRENLALSQFRQILHLVPEMYTVHWALLHGSAKVTLTVCGKQQSQDSVSRSYRKWLTPSVLAVRRECFRQRLTDFVRASHQKWLAKEDFVQFEPYQRGRWHRAYNVDKLCAAVTLASLPSKPSTSRSTATGACQIQRQLKQRREAESKLATKFEKRALQKRLVSTPAPFGKARSRLLPTASLRSAKVSTPSVSPIPIPSNLKHLDSSFLEGYKAKAKARKVLKKQKEVVSGVVKRTAAGKRVPAKTDDKQWNALRYTVAVARSCFLSRKKGTMSLQMLVRDICRRHRDSHTIAAAEIEKQLQLLETLRCKIFTTRKGHTGVHIANFDLKTPLAEARKEIDSYLK